MAIQRHVMSRQAKRDRVLEVAFFLAIQRHLMSRQHTHTHTHMCVCVCVCMICNHQLGVCIYTHKLHTHCVCVCLSLSLSVSFCSQDWNYWEDEQGFPASKSENNHQIIVIKNRTGLMGRGTRLSCKRN